LAFVPPFESTNHVIPPKLINQDLLPGAVPTNAFWTNFLVGDDHGLNQGAGQVTLSPYTVRNLPQRLEVSYGNDRRVVSNESIVEYFNADIAFSGFSNDQTKRATSREVVAFDPFSVTLQYYFQNETNDNANHFFKPFLVRGSPYMTVEYQNISPLLEFNSTIKKINQKPILNSNTFTDSRFEIEMEVYSTKNTSKLQKWIIYFEEERTLKVKFVNEIHQAPYSVTGWINAFTLYRLIDQRPYTGVIRAAIVPEDPQDDTIKLLDQHVALYPIRTSIQHEVNGLTGKIHFCWETKQFRSIKHVPSLLVLADPHHMDSFSPIQSPGFEIQKQMGHRTLKSYMTPILLGQNHCWILEEKLSKIMWNAPQNVPDQYVAPIKEALLKDANFTPQALDPYFFGKEISRQARLVLIADQLKLEETRDHLLNHMEKWIEPWMIGQNMDPFVYDKKWGGICSKNGLAGVFWMTDFGNGWYNDHVSTMYNYCTVYVYSYVV
jgi:endo-1,3(4)-beta-glucanase